MAMNMPWDYSLKNVTDQKRQILFPDELENDWLCQVKQESGKKNVFEIILNFIIIGRTDCYNI